MNHPDTSTPTPTLSPKNNPDCCEMGMPVPRFEGNPRKRPPPLDLTHLASEDDDAFEPLFETIRRLIKMAEERFPGLARWNALVARALAETPLSGQEPNDWINGPSPLAADDNTLAATSTNSSNE